MKLSAFLAVSVPLVAMSQSPASAASDTLADTGSWLKASIATLKPKSAQPKSSTTVKVAHALPATNAPVVKLRPFVPNRYLPRESELRRALVAQQAQVDNSIAMAQPGGQPLSGEISTSYVARAATPYDQYSMGSMMSQAPPVVPRKPLKSNRKQVGTRAPRVVPNQQPVLPEQLTQAASVAPIIPEPPTQRQPLRTQFPVSMPMTGFSQQPAMNMGMAPAMNMNMPASQNMVMQRPLTSPAFEQPQLSMQEQAALDRLVAQNRPTQVMDFNGEICNTQDNPANGAGPAPFPLNLLPGNAMRYLHASHQHANVPQARFGSWHEASALPESGFHSYLQRRQPQMFSYSAAAVPKARKVEKRSAKVSSSTGARPVVATLPQRAPAVESYPVYTSASGAAY